MQRKEIMEKGKILQYDLNYIRKEMILKNTLINI